MQPDFNQKTIDTLAKRAAFICSNPDCRVSTVGPNSDPKKSTVIGEAAHIFGARPKSKRYRSKMTDVARAEITNAIWLCRNCHKLIDTDENKYSNEILFSWREEHEKYTQCELGSASERIQFEQENLKSLLFKDYSPSIRRIVIDKPSGWEWRLSAELMRYLNQPVFRKMDDLREELYIKPQKYINEEEVFDWVREWLAEASNMLSPAVGLIEKLNKSWGKPGEEGNEEEILHITCLIRDHLEQIVLCEEKVYFVNYPEEFDKVFDLLKNTLGSQAKKLEDIPDSLDEAVSSFETNHEGTVENPYKIEKSIEFDLPKGWGKKISRELKRATKRSTSSEEDYGCMTSLIFIIIFIWLISILF